jgi:DeoR/GlpR family transcriptional regulator of sugar metabolism
VAVARAMMANARRALRAADCGKFVRNATHFAGNLSDCTALAMDGAPPAAIRSLVREGPLKLIIAGD